MKTRKLKISLYTILTDVESDNSFNVYENGRVPKGATFPYITYSLNLSTESNRDADTDINFLLELDIFDYLLTKNTAILDEITDDVVNEFNSKNVIDNENGFFYRLEKINYLPNLPTIDEHTFRRQLVYNLKYAELIS